MTKKIKKKRTENPFHKREKYKNLTFVRVNIFEIKVGS